MLDKIRKTIIKYDMLSLSNDVTVALSGGADSVALLVALIELKEELKITLSAFHLNHMLRSEEADRDESFVRELCKRYNIPLTVCRENIKEIAKARGESIELCARNVRYELYKKHSKGVVATAHTMSDNLETVIYNLVRGSGIKGLTGIPPVRDNIVRPLIDCSREEVEAFLKERNIGFVTDSTNLSDDYSRNFIRHNIIPQLKKLNPSAEQTVMNGSANLREDADFLDRMAAKIYCIVQKLDAIDCELLCDQHPAVAKRVLARYYSEKSGFMPDSLHTVRMYETAINGGKISLPFNMYAEKKDGLFKIAEEKEKIVARYQTEIVYGKMENDNIVYNLLLKNTIDCDRIVGSLKVRTRQEGDKIRLSGRNCTKSLKKLYNELKIPEQDRENLPVAADDEGVVWIYSVGVAERVAVNKKTRRFARFEAEKYNQ